MSISPRNSRRLEFERELERFAPTKIRLIRALPYTCTSCYTSGRLSLSLACTICNGTGYLGLARGANLNVPPAAKVFFMHGDVQLGHGLNGAGGDLVRVLSELGKQGIGEAVLFCKVDSYDSLTGEQFHPLVDETLTRPDRLVTSDGLMYDVTRALVGNFGSELVFRQFSLERGSQGVA